jgi:hypothetical protein
MIGLDIRFLLEGVGLHQDKILDSLWKGWAYRLRYGIPFEKHGPIVDLDIGSPSEGMGI